MSSNNLISKWYIVHTYSGHEYRVKRNLEERINNLGVQKHIPEVIVPDEEKVEIKRNKRKIIPQKFFPGYVMVKVLVEPMETPSGIEYKMDSDIWYTIRNTPGVSGFIGTGYYPSPLSDEEALKILNRIQQKKESIPKFDVSVNMGDVVQINKGSFSGTQGIVKAIDEENGILKLEIEIFNRRTIIEARFDEVNLL